MRPHGVDYALATEADDEAIRRLLRDTPMRGTISLSFEREPSYFRGAGLGGAQDRTIIAVENGRMLCLGRCTSRACWVNGAEVRASYLGELRLAAAAAGRVDIVRRGYRYFRELARSNPTDVTFTSIAADNQRARRLLERGLPGMPRYSFLTDFVTLIVSVRTLERAASAPLESAEPDEIADFLNQEGKRSQLATVWTPERLLSLDRHDLPLERFRLVRVDGKIVAAGALWDQRRFRQTVIRGYAPLLSALRPVLNLAARFGRRPRLPAVSSVLAQGFISPLAIAPHYPALLPPLVATLGRDAARCGLEFVTLGFPADDPSLRMLRQRFGGRAYRSRLYRVSWPDDYASVTLDARPIRPEIAWL